MLLIRLVAMVAMVFVGSDAQAQTYLVNAYKPKASLYYEGYRYSGASSKELRTAGGYAWQGGFTLGMHSVLINEGQGFATFDIQWQWETLTFVMGPARGSTGAEGSATSVDPYVMVVKVDGRKVVDKVLRPYDIPQRYTVDVSGAREVTFEMPQGVAKVAIAECVLWKKGQTPRPLQNPRKTATKAARLIKDIPAYFCNTNFMQIVAPTFSNRGFGRASSSHPEAISMGGQTYTHALYARMDMSLEGSMEAWAFFNLEKKYETLTFRVGSVGAKSNGTVWLAASADGKIIYEKEWKADDLPEMVTVSVKDCERLKVWAEKDRGFAQGIAFTDLMVYPPGMAPTLAADAQAGHAGAMVSHDATIDPRLKALPDVCRLMSNIKPYNMRSSVEKQVFDGNSDHITFSMGGVRFSEGFILYKRPWLMDDDISSDITFDLGNEFDYISFTSGFLGKSWYMNKDVLRVYADDKLVMADTLHGTMMNRHYVVPLNKCRKLKFECRGYGSVMGSSAFGCSDLVLYRGEPVPNDLFVHPKPMCPDEVDLLDLGKPYIHFVSQYEETRDRLCLTGESLRNFYRMPDGSKVHKGFVLQTSTHFSLDAGVLGVLSNDPDDPESNGGDAMGAVVGGAAVGSAFVAMGAVGGAYIGATMTAAAAAMVIAAGGTALESSLAAFNTYGVYNSLTFTVACQNADPGLLDDKRTPEQVKASPEMYHPETLLIGSNGQVIAELNLFGAMEPQTVTLPIEGCEQLMFFLVNTGETTPVFVFYDLKLSTERVEAYIPADALSVESHQVAPQWDSKARAAFCEKYQMERVRNSGARVLDTYLSDVYDLWNKTRRYAEEPAPGYYETYYLEDEYGALYRAVLLNNGGNADADFTYGRCDNIIAALEREVKELGEMRVEAASLHVDMASASLDLPSLGLGAFAYGKIYRRFNQVLKACNKLVDKMYKEKCLMLEELQDMRRCAVDPEGKKSTEALLFIPMRQGEPLPEGAHATPLRNFYR